jgi:hypothetical protein
LREARLRGRTVLLRPVLSADYERLRSIELSASLLQRWRHRGSTPAPGAWAQGLEHGIVCQFLVVAPHPDGEQWVGLVAAYDMAPDQGFAYLATTKFDLGDMTLRLFEGMVLFVDHLFDSWPLRKLHAESLEFNFEQLAGGADRFFEVEGRLKDHVFLQGRWWDQVVLTLRRERWEADSPRYRRLLRLDAEPAR